jgi:hypothetical protein
LFHHGGANRARTYVTRRRLWITSLRTMGQLSSAIVSGVTLSRPKLNSPGRRRAHDEPWSKRNRSGAGLRCGCVHHAVIMKADRGPLREENVTSTLRGRPVRFDPRDQPAISGAWFRPEVVQGLPRRPTSGTVRGAPRASAQRWTLRRRHRGRPRSPVAAERRPARPLVDPL